ncbi:MAG: NfeD family protein [bacterium]|jgi:membrane protein implicated in regulation of membrane protease activity|nr:NfeD family protein [bacterium]
MIQSGAVFWWIAAALLVAVELATGTFYLLMLALGAVAAALAAHLGLASIGQMLAAAVVGGGAVFLWYLHRRRQPPAPGVQEDRNMLLDIGSRVRVDRWEEDGTARVQHRGASWAARWAGPGEPAPGEHVIRKIDGSCLLLEK